MPSESTFRQAAPVRVLFVAAMGGLGGPVKRLATLLSNLNGVDRVLIKPKSAALDARLEELRATDEYIVMRHSAQRNRFGALVIGLRIFLRCLSRRRSIHVIHANGLVEFALSWPSAFVFRIPVVTWIGNYESPRFVKRLSPLMRGVSRRTSWNAVSPFAARVVVEAGLNGDCRVNVVSNIVDPAEFEERETAESASQGEKGVVTIGYVQVARWEKGFDLLVPVIKSLKDLEGSVKFLVYASRNDHPSWMSLEEIGEPLVEVRPRTAAIGSIYAECDIVFSPSRRESFNRVVAESLMSGTPVVASDLAPVREVVGDAGLFFPVDDSQAAVAQLRRLIGDVHFRAELGALGAERSRRWLPGPVARHFEKLYSQAGSTQFVR